jgi:hypothetical protein
MRKTMIVTLTITVLTLIYTVNNQNSIVSAKKPSLDEIYNSKIETHTEKTQKYKNPESTEPIKGSEDKKIELNELYMTIKIPNDWIIFTRNIDDDDENLKLLRIDAQTLKNQYLSKKIFLNAICLNPTNEVVVTMIEGFESIYNFNEFTEKQLENMANDTINSNETKKAGITYTNYSIYTQKNIKYVVFDLNQQAEGNIVYGKQYYTVHNGQAISITLQSYNGKITDDFALKHRSIVDSINFTETFSNPNKKSNEYETITGSKILDKSLFSIIGSAILGGIMMIIGFLRNKPN